MTLLILGLILWIAAHLFKRMLPRQRAAMGDAGKGLVAVAVVGALVLIILGYRATEFIPVWAPPAFFTHINNLAMVLAVWIYGSSAAKGAKAWPADRIRHPQLVAVALWALAHLLVNGDLASIVLFGTLLVWAGAEIAIINKSEPHWTPPRHAGGKTYVRLATITAVVFAIVTAIHYWLGVSPFPS